MPSLSAVKASNAQYAPSYVPTAVFIGGTSGIGRAMAEAFAAQTNGNANIIIIGRNKTTAEQIIASFPKPTSPDTKHEFVYCDAQEMKNVHVTTQELLGRLEKINYLVLTTGGLASARKDTEEGNDVSIALRYYCRAKFIVELTPLLEKAKAKEEDAKVLSVLAAAFGGKINVEDLSVVHNWSIASSSNASGTYGDIMIKVQSERHPTIAFMHIYPGAVDTPSLHFHWAASIAATLAKPFLRTPANAAQWMLYPVLNSEFSSGGYWFTKEAETLALPATITPEIIEKVWKHTQEVAQIE